MRTELVALAVRALVYLQNCLSISRCNLQEHDCLDRHCLDRWIDRGGTHAWSVRSPDLNILYPRVWEVHERTGLRTENQQQKCFSSDIHVAFEAKPRPRHSLECKRIYPMLKFAKRQLEEQFLGASA